MLKLREENNRNPETWFAEIETMKSNGQIVPTFIQCEYSAIARFSYFHAKGWTAFLSVDWPVPMDREQDDADVDRLAPDGAAFKWSAPAMSACSITKSDDDRKIGWETQRAAKLKADPRTKNTAADDLQIQDNKEFVQWGTFVRFVILPEAAPELMEHDAKNAKDFFIWQCWNDFGTV